MEGKLKVFTFDTRGFSDIGEKVTAAIAKYIEEEQDGGEEEGELHWDWVVTSMTSCATPEMLTITLFFGYPASGAEPS